MTELSKKKSSYDIIIIGGGPAGLTAGIYTARGRLSSLLIERGLIGGLITETELVENFPGFPQGVSGFELGELMHQQAQKYGLPILVAEVTGLKLKGKQKIVETTEGSYSARAVIIASGAIPTNNKLETAIPGIFAVGDVRASSARQAVVAAGDGATAAIYAEKFLTG